MKRKTTDEEAGGVPVYNATNGNNNWASPRDFLTAALAELDLPAIGLDLAAECSTALAPLYFAPDHADPRRRNALLPRSSWHIRRDETAPGAPSTRYLNPPYGRLCVQCRDKVWKGKKSGLPKAKWCESRKHTSTTVWEWIERAAREGTRGLDPLLLLVPARTDTDWWHSHVHGLAARVVLIKGRLTFLDAALKATDCPAPFPSALIEYVPCPAASAWVTQYGTMRNDGRMIDKPERRLVVAGEVY